MSCGIPQLIFLTQRVVKIMSNKVLKKYKKWYIINLQGRKNRMIKYKNAESLAAVHTHTHTGIFTNEKTLVAFLYPKISNKAK